MQFTVVIPVQTSLRVSFAARSLSEAKRKARRIIDHDYVKGTDSVLEATDYEEINAFSVLTNEDEEELAVLSPSIN